MNLIVHFRFQALTILILLLATTAVADSGRIKVGRLLLDFLKTDPTATPWFRQNP